MSTNPGATTQPSAWMVRLALVCCRRPTAATRPSLTPTSAVYAGSPEPSTTVPPQISRSSSGMGGARVVVIPDSIDAGRVLAEDLALLRCREVLDVFEQFVDDSWVLGVRMRKVARPD